MPNRNEAAAAKAQPIATGRLRPLRLFSTPQNFVLPCYDSSNSSFHLKGLFCGHPYRLQAFPKRVDEWRIHCISRSRPRAGTNSSCDRKLPRLRKHARNKVCRLSSKCRNAVSATNLFNQTKHVPFLYPQNILGIYLQESRARVVGTHFCGRHPNLLCDESFRLRHRLVQIATRH